MGRVRTDRRGHEATLAVPAPRARAGTNRPGNPRGRGKRRILVPCSRRALAPVLKHQKRLPRGRVKLARSDVSVFSFYGPYHILF